VISVDDQVAITDTLSHYAWSLDRGDSDGVVECFTPTGSVITDWGQPVRHEGAAGIRAYYEAAMRSPGFQGRQHHIRPISFEPSTDGYLVTSYFHIINTIAGESPTLMGIGYYRDYFVKHNGEWLLREKTMGPWNSEAPIAKA
jgi:hypothetical protein